MESVDVGAGERTRAADQLTAAAALEHLATSRIGRLGFVIDDQPHVLPINIAVDDEGRLAFRTNDHSALSHLDGAKVAVEVDGANVTDATGWFVEVVGVVREITDATDLGAWRLRQLPVDSWAPRPRDRWMAVLPLAITGRRVTRDPDRDVSGWFAGIPAS